MIRIEREDNGQKGRFVIYENDTFSGGMTFSQARENKFIIDHTGVEKVFLKYAKCRIEIIVLCAYFCY